MRDLLVITPTRGRPDYALRLIQAWGQTSILRTDIVFGLDSDDPELPAYEERFGHLRGYTERVKWSVGGRQQLGPWTNDLALQYATGYRALASLGDDHVPRTPGWDAQLLTAIEANGGGFAWGEGYARPGFPEAVAVGSRVVDALGWFCEPSLDHWYVDQVWWDLSVGTRAGTYLGNTIISHEHVPADETAHESWNRLAYDRKAYARWLLERHDKDVETVRGALTL